MNQRAVAVVVDPIQRVKGKLVIDAFRSINPQTIMLGQEPLQTLATSTNHQSRPLIHGLNRHYYSIAINYRKNELEEKMLLNLHKKKWADGLNLRRFDTHSKTNDQTVQVSLSSQQSREGQFKKIKNKKNRTTQHSCFNQHMLTSLVFKQEMLSTRPCKRRTSYHLRNWRS